MVATRNSPEDKAKEDKANAARRLKEKREAEKAMEKTVAEKEKKREEEKKRRAEEKAAEEERAKAKRDEDRRKEKELAEKDLAAKQAVSNKDAPNEGINALLTSLSTSPGGDGEEEEVHVVETRDEEDSGEKKKKKKKQTTPAVAPLLKSGRYSVAKVSPPTTRPPHAHVHTRIILDAAIELNKDDPIASFTNGLCTLFNNAKMVDEYFAICPVKEGGSSTLWHSAGDIPNNMTAVSSHISISGNNVRIFEKQRKWEGARKKESNFSNTVYFSFAIACDIEPTTLIGRVGIEWTRAGGTRLMVKTLPCFETMSPLVFYYLYNESHPATILEEFKKILLQTQIFCTDDSDLSDATVALGPLPAMAFRKMVPKIPGQDTSSFKHISHKAQYARRAWHLEVEVSAVPTIKELVEKAKHYGCIEAFWGKHTHVTEVATFDTTATDLKRLATTVNRHTNYQCSLTTELLKGIVNVDHTTRYISTDGKVQGDVSLRDVLLKHFKMSDGHSLFAEVHQRVVTSPVEVVFPAMEEAETMVAKMNRHLPAFVYYYLVDKGLSEDFALDLVRNSCCPTLVVEILDCKWESDRMTITTMDDEKDGELYEKMETADWFKDELGLVSGGKKKKNYVNPELLYDLDGDRSIKTLHERNDKARQDSGDSASDTEGGEEEEDMSTDSASKSDFEKSHQVSAFGKAGGTPARGVSFAASPSVGLPGQNGAAGSG